MLDHNHLLAPALHQAQLGLAEGGIPVGAAIFNQHGELLSTGRNRRVQQNDPSLHGETDAFRRAGRQPSYRDLIMVTTLAPCWYCSGLLRQFRFGTVLVGDSQNFPGALPWLRESGLTVIDLANPGCIRMMAAFIRDHPTLWNEDIGEPPPAGTPHP